MRPARARAPGAQGAGPEGPYKTETGKRLLCKVRAAGAAHTSKRTAGRFESGAVIRAARWRRGHKGGGGHTSCLFEQRGGRGTGAGIVGGPGAPSSRATSCVGVLCGFWAAIARVGAHSRRLAHVCGSIAQPCACSSRKGLAARAFASAGWHMHAPLPAEWQAGAHACGQGGGGAAAVEPGQRGRVGRPAGAPRARRRQRHAWRGGHSCARTKHVDARG